MKRIILKSLTLTNWRGEKNRTTVFNPVSTTISGANGLGKSRHFDAFIWLLFGKDSQDRKDYEIKTRINGEELHNVECSVEGMLEVDGDNVKIKRSFSENWVKPRGTTEQVFKGNKTECWWNDVPVNVSEYEKRVNEIIEDSVFKIITNPKFFFEMKWQAQREQLFQLAGAISDNEILDSIRETQSEKEVSVITSILESKKSLSDSKKELSARKRRLKEELLEIQPRIDQTRKMTPESEDFEALEKELKEIEAKMSNIDKRIYDINEDIRAKSRETREKRAQIEELKTKQQSIVFNARENERERVFKLNANRRSIEAELKALYEDRSPLLISLKRKEDSVKYIESQQTEKQEELKKLRDAWANKNEETYIGDDRCPYCKQELPQEMKDKAVEIFNKEKSNACNVIAEKGKKISDELEELKNDLKKAKEEIEKIDDQLEKIDAEIKDKTDNVTSLEIAKENEVVPEEIEEWSDIQDKIKEIEDSIQEASNETSTGDLMKEKSSINEAKREIDTRLSKREAIRRSEKEIKSLEEKGKELAQQIADAEKEEHAIQTFVSAKVSECENRINNLFQIVRFKLFDYTIEDSKKENPIECCIPILDGRYYGSANAALKVNAGLDVINTLCRFHGVNAPIFCDNAESVNKHIDTSSQIIFLKVTDDKQLVIS